MRLRFPNIDLAETPRDLERSLRTAFAILMDRDVSVDDTTLISMLPGSVVVQVCAEVSLSRLATVICTSYPTGALSSSHLLGPCLGFSRQTETVFTTVAGAAAFATRVECCSMDLFNRTFHDGACTRVASSSTYVPG